MLHHFYHIFIEWSSYKVKVGEDKGFVDVKSNRYYIFCIFECQLLWLLKSHIFEKKLFIVSLLDDQGNVKSVLKPPKRCFKLDWNAKEQGKKSMRDNFLLLDITT